MKNYSFHNILEAAQEETSINFISAIKCMDTKVAELRLSAILKSNVSDADFLSVAAQFISLINTKTSVDP